MTQIAFQDGKIILRDGKIGTGQECCCNECLQAACPWRIYPFPPVYPDDVVYDYELTLTCNGNTITETGQIINGDVVPDANNPDIIFTKDNSDCLDSWGVQFFCNNPNIPCTYQLDVDPPEGYSGCYEDQFSIVGEYVLPQLGGSCNGAGATATLTIL